MAVESADDLNKRGALERATQLLYDEMDRVGFGSKAFAIVVVEPSNGEVLWYSSNTRHRGPLLRALRAWIAAQLGVAVLALGCGSSIGPVVTDVQAGAAGSLLVQRCHVAHDPWSARNTLERCTVSTVQPSR